MRGIVFIIVFIWVNATACKKGIDLTVPVKTEPATLKDLPFPFGAAISVDLFRSNLTYKTIVQREYNSITLENAMKIGVIHPSENFYNWQDADEIVQFALNNGQKVHGHTLIWHSDIPQWIYNFQGNSAAWEMLFKTHIQRIVSHYKGKVKSWDVVNEAYEDNGSLSRSIWLEKIGSDYIAKAFTYAHEADPDALLFYNDYGQEYGYEFKSEKGQAIVTMANSLLKRNIPIHGLGLQMHTKYTQSDDNISKAINLAASTGLKIHLSELDVAMNVSYDTALTFSKSLEEMQAAKFKSIVQIYNKLPATQKFGITTWNVGDKDSWIPVFFKVPDWPTIFNEQYEKKLAYQAIFDGVK